MGRKVSSLILIIIGFIATFVVGMYFLVAVITIYADLPKCIAEAVDDQAIAKCNASCGTGLGLILIFFTVVGLPVAGGGTLINIIATLIYRYRKDFKWDGRLIFMIVCDVMPAIIVTVTYCLIYFCPTNA